MELQTFVRAYRNNISWADDNDEKIRSDKSVLIEEDGEKNHLTVGKFSW